MAFKRHLEEKEVGDVLTNLMAPYFGKGVTSEVSFSALMKRWEPFLMGLPEPTPENLKQAKKFRDIDEDRRKKHLDGI